jgi:hypothetical protein
MLEPAEKPFECRRSLRIRHEIATNSRPLLLGTFSGEVAVQHLGARGVG